jgi:hypothetical protein
VSSRIAATVSPAVASTKSVAPKSRVFGSLAGLVSTATIRDAPATRAAWMTLSPIPPAPMTTTASPGCTRARLSTAPAPVSTAHPIRHAVASGTSWAMGTACPAWTTMRSLNVDSAAKLWIAVSPRRKGVADVPKDARHIVGRPAAQDAH